MQISVLGIDLGKNSCSVVGLDPAGRIVLHRRLGRARVIELSSQVRACVIAMGVLRRAWGKATEMAVMQISHIS